MQEELRLLECKVEEAELAIRKKKTIDLHTLEADLVRQFTHLGFDKFDQVSQYAQEAMKSVQDDISMVNLANFIHLRDDSIRAFQIAKDNDERYQLILALQDKDRRQLGIPMPVLNLFKKSAVEDGKLTL